MEKTTERKGGLTALVTIAIVALALGGFASVYALGRAPAPSPVDRTILMTAIEYKGTFGANESQPPGTVVEAYRWDPSYIVVNKGDRVTLSIFGVNGREHPTTISGYGLSFTVRRGEWTNVSFTASIAGVFEIVCSIPSHATTMHAYLHVVG